jgi:ABC-type molybdate transport system substrate-binding protein
MAVDKHQAITYPIAIIKGTEKETPAQRFVDFVLGVEGQNILLQYGFGSP